jgi:hypothetical protein
VVLARREGDEGACREVAIGSDRVRRERLLQPVHAVVLAVRDYLHQVRRGVAGLGVHRDVELVPELAPHPCDPLGVALRGVPDPELDRGVAAVDEHPDFRRERFRRLEAEGEAAHVGAKALVGAAEQPVDGLPEELPLEVPEGDVDAREGDDAPRAEAVGLDLLAAYALPDALGVEGIGADDEGPDPALDDLGHGRRVLAVMGLPVADRPVVRGHLDEHEVALDVGAERISQHVSFERA